MGTENAFSIETAGDDFSVILEKQAAGTPLTDEEEKFIEAIQDELPYIHFLREEISSLQLCYEELYVLRFLLTPERQNRIEEDMKLDQIGGVDTRTFAISTYVMLHYIHDHKEQTIGLFDQNERNRLVTLLTKEFALEKMGVTISETNLAKTKARLEQSEKTIDDVLDIVGYGNAIHLLYGTPQLPVVTATRVEDRIFTTDKTCEVTFTRPNLCDGQPTNIKTSNHKNKPGPSMTLQIKKLEESGVLVSGGERLEIFDREVFDAINSLYLAGNNYITPIQILKVFAADYDARPQKNMQELVRKSIDKLRATYIKIDATNEVKMKGVNKLIYEDFIISATKVTISLNGQEVEAYKLNGPSPLYEYGNTINRISRLPLNVLTSKIEKNKEGVTLQNVIIRRITAAKNGKSHMSNVIRYESLYEIVGIHSGLPKTAALRKRKKAVRDKTCQVLDDLVEHGVIKSYTQNKKGKEIYSVSFCY